MKKKRKSRHQGILSYIILIVFFATILQNALFTGVVFRLSQRLGMVTTAEVTGTLGLCMNAPPSFNITCNETIGQDDDYSCQIIGTDINPGQTLAFSSDFITNPSEPLFNISPTGWINFTPGAEDVGNHSVNITLNDDSVCDNGVAWDTFNFSVENLNDPPYLVVDIPKKELVGNYSVSFYLDDYFSDPDGDDLTYRVSSTTYFLITIADTSEVILKAKQCDEEEDVIFVATDPYNASADSNVVRINCTTPPRDSNQRSSSAGASRTSCEPNWVCTSWGSCQPDGTQSKYCVDAEGCEAPKYFYINCTYILTCFNGVKDLNEDGIDCGGPCPACECKENWTCSNWSACSANNTQIRSCRDLNKCKSTKLKPEETKRCDYLAHCYNRMQDADEEGIDCGGSCEACRSIEVPEAFQFQYLFWLKIVLGIVGAAICWLIVYRLFHKQLKEMGVKMRFVLNKTVQKVILVDKLSKEHLLKELFRLENILEKNIKTSSKPSKKITQTDNHVVSVGRDYFRCALGIQKEAVLEDVDAALKKKVPYQRLREILQGTFLKLTKIEAAKGGFDDFELLTTVEELLELLNLTADMQSNDLRRGVKRLALPKNADNMATLRNICFDTYIALQFDEAKIAKKKYLSILKLYESLKEKERSLVFDDLLRLEKEIEFADSIYRMEK